MNGPTASNMEHLGGIKEIGSHATIHSEIIWILNNSTYPKINEDCLVVVVDHYVVRFDISVYHLSCFVTIIQSFNHIYEVEAHLHVLAHH